jgi:hypothetical protein
MHLCRKRGNESQRAAFDKQENKMQKQDSRKEEPNNI